MPRCGVFRPERTWTREIANEEIEILKYTPPIPWVQFNDWKVCCDDYMQYIGEWEQKDTVAYVFQCPNCGKMTVVCQSY